MLPTQMQQEKYHYCRTEDKKGDSILNRLWQRENITPNVSQFMEALTFICCKWRGQWNPRLEPIGILQAGKGQVVARGVCAPRRLC